MVRSFGLAFESTGFRSQLRGDTIWPHWWVLIERNRSVCGWLYIYIYIYTCVCATIFILVYPIIHLLLDIPLNLILCSFHLIFPHIYIYISLLNLCCFSFFMLQCIFLPCFFSLFSHLITCYFLFPFLFVSFHDFLL